MSDRNYDQGHNAGKGMVYIDLSFLTNAAANPAAASFRGTALGDHVASVVYSATGKYTITLKDKFRYLVAKACDLEDIASPDGAYATIGNVLNEGSSTLAPSFVVTTCAATGTPTAYTGRRLSVSLTLKNSTVGV